MFRFNIFNFCFVILFPPRQIKDVSSQAMFEAFKFIGLKVQDSKYLLSLDMS